MRQLATETTIFRRKYQLTTKLTCNDDYDFEASESARTTRCRRSRFPRVRSERDGHTRRRTLRLRAVRTYHTRSSELATTTAGNKKQKKKRQQNKISNSATSVFRPPPKPKLRYLTHQVLHPRSQHAMISVLIANGWSVDRAPCGLQLLMCWTLVGSATASNPSTVCIITEIQNRRPRSSTGKNKKPNLTARPRTDLGRRKKIVRIHRRQLEW